MIIPRKTSGFALLLALLASAVAVSAQNSVEQITANTNSEIWGVRHSVTSHGKILWVDADGTVVLFDGMKTNEVQRQGALGGVETPVFALGSGAASNSVIAVWRRGQDSGWVSVDRAAPVPVTATNPIDPDAPLNAEGVAVADGNVFMVLQGASGGQTFKHVFRIDPITGTATNLTGTALVPGAEGRLSTSGGQAAWPFYLDDTTVQLHFYDGATVRVMDTNITGNPHLSRGRLVYTKPVDGVDQVFLYDSTRVNSPIRQLTRNADGTNFFPRTDGWHVAWLRNEAGSTNTRIVLNGGLALSDADVFAEPSREFRDQPFQLHRGQFLWKNTRGELVYAALGRPAMLNLAPAISFGGNTCCTPWLADGFIALLGLSSDGGDDTEVFRITGTPPSAADQLAAPLLVNATPGSGQTTIEWDHVIGAAGYNVYLALDPRVTAQNYESLVGARKFANVTSPFVISELTNRAYFIVVAPIFGGIEGPPSITVPAMVWTQASGLTNNVYSVASGLTNGTTAYAAANRKVYKSVDAGFTWTALSGFDGPDVRALAVDGPRVYAATRDVFGGLPAQIWRSVNAGASWEAVVPDGGTPGESIKALAVDPIAPATLYAGNFRLPEMTDADSFIIKSTNGGNTWFHLPDPAFPVGAEIRAYSIAVDPLSNSRVYVGGSSTPNLAKSLDGGETWTIASPGRGFIYSVAIDPRQPNVLYVGNADFIGSLQGVHKSTNGGLSWTIKNNGLPQPVPRVNALLIDPINSSFLHAGTDAGYYFSPDAGETWLPGHGGLAASAQSINALALTQSRQLMAATSAGVFVLDISGLNLTLPALRIARSGNMVSVSWDAAAEGFILQTTGSLAPPVNWIVPARGPSIVNGRNVFIDQASAGNRFYRLRTP